MKTLFYSLTKSMGVALLIGSLVTMQACSSDGKKESRTEDALEKAGDAFAADAKDAQARAKDKIQEADEKLTSKSKEASVDFRHDREVVMANLKKRTRQLDAKIDKLQGKAKRSDETTRRLDKMKDERDDLKDDLDKAKNATADAWQDVKKSFKRTGDKIGDALDKADDKLKRN